MHKELEELLREVPEYGQQRALRLYQRQPAVKRVGKGKRATPVRLRLLSLTFTHLI
jgi:hypothetical protein